MLCLIDSARKSIRMFSYMFCADGSGDEVLAALIAAAKRGVNVQLIIDSFVNWNNLFASEGKTVNW